MEFSERAEILLFARENIALKLNRLLRLSNVLLSKIPPARKISLTGNWPLLRIDKLIISLSLRKLPNGNDSSEKSKGSVSVFIILVLETQFRYEAT